MNCTKRLSCLRLSIAVAARFAPQQQHQILVPTTPPLVIWLYRHLAAVMCSQLGPTNYPNRVNKVVGRRRAGGGAPVLKSYPHAARPRREREREPNAPRRHRQFHTSSPLLQWSVHLFCSVSSARQPSGLLPCAVAGQRSQRSPAPVLCASRIGHR